MPRKTKKTRKKAPCSACANGQALPSAARGEARRPSEPPEEHLCDDACGPRCIAAKMVDGGTAFVIRADPDKYHAVLRRLLAEVRGGGDAGRSRPKVVSVPIVGFRDLTLWDGRDSLMAKTAIRGGSGRYVVFSFPDRADIEIRRDGRIKVVAAAPELWVDGLRRWMARWLHLVSVLSGMGGCSPEAAHAIGWQTHHLELCSDFQGIVFEGVDGENFTSAVSRRRYHALRDGDVSEIKSVSGGRLQSIGVGTRFSDSSMSVQAKSHYLRTIKGIEPAASCYSAVWSRSGRFAADQGVFRVEFRLRRSALLYRPPKGSVDVDRVDLRNPSALLDDSVLSLVWAHHVRRRRLVVPSASRRRRCPTDPRWQVVEDAAGVEPVPLTQDRSVRQAERQVRLNRVADKVAREAMRFSCLLGSPAIDDAHLVAVAYRTLERARVDREEFIRRAIAENEFVDVELRENEEPR